MGTVLLGGVEPAFAAAVRKAPRPDSPLLFEDAHAGDKIFSKIAASPHTIDALILGSAFADPVATAQRCHAMDKDMSIVIVSRPDSYRQLHQELRFAPFLGSHVRCLPTDQVDSPATLVNEAAAMTRERRAFRTKAGSVRVAAESVNPWRRKPAEYLDRILEHAPVGVALLDRAMTILALNREAQGLLATREAEALGKPMVSFFVEEQRRDFDHFLQRSAATIGRRPPEIFRHEDADGTQTSMEIIVSMLSHSEGDAWLMVIMTDCTQRLRTEEQRQLMMHELDHRVKNSLASIIAMARQTSRGSENIEQFIETFEGRVRSLARTHEVLAHGHWQGAELAEIVSLVVRWQSPQDNPRIDCTGDSVFLPAAVAQPLCMTLHELMTNATKYGAMSVPDGNLRLRWHLTPDSVLTLTWNETDGPPAAEPNGSGFGTTLIRGLIEYELGGHVALEYRPTGLMCRLEIPLPSTTEPAPSGS